LVDGLARLRANVRVVYIRRNELLATTFEKKWA